MITPFPISPFKAKVSISFLSESIVVAINSTRRFVIASIYFLLNIFSFIE